MLEKTDVGTHRGVCPAKSFVDHLGPDYNVVVCCRICNTFTCETQDNKLLEHIRVAHGKKDAGKYQDFLIFEKK